MQKSNAGGKPGQSLFSGLIEGFMDLFDGEESNPKKNNEKSNYYQNPFGGFLP